MLHYFGFEVQSLMHSKQNLTLVTQPQDYFRELVQAAMERHRLSAQPETEFYLVNLLHQFMLTDRLFNPDAEGKPRDAALALMVKDALEQPQPELQRSAFRRVGDVSLYVAGYFQDSLNRKLVDVDYYIDMGGTAYQQVARMAGEKIMQSLYEELADKFASFVDVLA